MSQNLIMSNLLIQSLILLLGVIILMVGRRLFWVTVGVAGFILGLTLAFNLLQDQPAWLVLAVAIAAGVVGAVAAIFLQKAAVALAGIVMGGYLLITALVALGVDLGNWRWLVYIIGAILGFILMVALFEVGLVILSSLFGAALIIQAINLQGNWVNLLFIVLAVIGIVIQLRSAPSPATPSPDS